MPAILANAREFLFNSDYPVDKVIYLSGGSFSMVGSSSGSENVTHGLPFIPLIGGYWSFTPDFSVTYEFGNGTFPSTTPAVVFQASIENISSNLTTIKMDWYNLGTTATVYYRLYGFEPDTSAADLPGIASSGSDFIVNTDNNYLKLLTASSAVSGTVTTYPVVHGLGYIPQALGWYEYAFVPNTIFPVTTESNIALEVNETSIVFINPFGDDVARLYWRIYADS